MTKTYKSLLAGVAALALAGGAFGTSASAEPAAGLKRLDYSQTETRAQVVQVQHRRFHRHRHYGHRHRRGRGWGTGAAIVGGVVAGALIADAARSASASDMERCADTYRSFDPSTGTYVGYDGTTRICPYLR